MAKLPGTVTTEIHSGHVRRPSSAVRSKSYNGHATHVSRDEGLESDECGDEVELHRIRVQREICIDSGSSASEGEAGWRCEGMRSPSVEDAWGMKRSVSAEKMV